MIDIVRLVPDDSDKRRVSLPIWDDTYAWWTDLVRAKLKPQSPAGPDQRTLAAKLGLNPSEVSRAISREKPLYDIVVALCDELGLPYPVILPESEAEALHLATQRRLFRRDQQIQQIKGTSGGGGVPIKAPTIKRARPRRSNKQPRT